MAVEGEAKNPVALLAGSWNASRKETKGKKEKWLIWDIELKIEKQFRFQLKLKDHLILEAITIRDHALALDGFELTK